MSKIVATNFVSNPLYSVTKLRVYLSVMIAVILLGVMYFSYLFNSLNQKIATANSSNESLQYEYDIAQRSSQSIPEYKVLEELERKVGIVKGIADTKGDTTIQLLGVIEEIIPEKAALIKFVHRPKIGEVDLTIKAMDTITLTAFVHELENNKKFSQVLITRQSHESNESDVISYDIKVVQD